MKEKKLKRSTKILIAVLAVVFLAAASAAVYAASSDTAGTSSDPVVTKSYVDNAVAAVSGSGQAQTTGGYQILELQAGETLIGSQNTQIIVRSGVVNAVIPGENGLSDLTAGTDLPNNVEVAKDHLLLVPRSDGRGIHALTPAFVMIQGDYTIE